MSETHDRTHAAPGDAGSAVDDAPATDQSDPASEPESASASTSEPASASESESEPETDAESAAARDDHVDDHDRRDDAMTMGWDTDSSPGLSIALDRDPFRTQIDADSVFIAPTKRVRSYTRPGGVVRHVIGAQLLLIVVGALPWWLLLHFGIEISALEIAWFVAIAVGIGLGVQGHARHQTWQSVFGWVTSATALALQLRGADLLLGLGLVAFDLMLAAFVLLALVLGRATVHEIDAVA